MYQKPFTLCLLIVVAFFAAGCVSSSRDVVGKSATQRPVWAEENKRLPDSDTRFFVSYKKTGVYRLELGMRQAQSEALANSKELFLQRLREEIKASAKDLRVDTPMVWSVVEQALANFSQTFYPSPGKVENTYFEQVQVKTSEGSVITFDIYVLVSLPLDMLGDSLVRIAESLAQSSDLQVKRLADDLRARWQAQE